MYILIKDMVRKWSIQLYQSIQRIPWSKDLLHRKVTGQETGTKFYNKQCIIKIVVDHRVQPRTNII